MAEALEAAKLCAPRLFLGYKEGDKQAIIYGDTKTQGGRLVTDERNVLVRLPYPDPHIFRASLDRLATYKVVEISGHRGNSIDDIMGVMEPVLANFKITPPPPNSSLGITQVEHLIGDDDHPDYVCHLWEGFTLSGELSLL